MITKENLRQVLTILGFSTDKEDKIYTKKWETFDCSISVDFENKKIVYPEEKGFTISEHQTCNFDKNENFVVLECVIRLLDKGYAPKHIELEPKWKLGRGASGGRADIWVRTLNEDNETNSLLIVECKTYGGEFNDEWETMQENGGQLFSYFQQEKETQFLCLYASDFTNSDIKFTYHLINVQDNEELLKTLKNPKSYKNSKNNKQLFTTWKETYQKEFATRGLFEQDIDVYNIGKNKYSIEDLHEVDEATIQKKYNEFATILRQHNVSGHENAFDKLVNLFLAKIVDEEQNPEELQFYWKGIVYDDYFRLQDRLQKLYKIGMLSFLNDEVTYVENDEIEKAFHFVKEKPDATKKVILNYFRQLKFFTNNDFAFIDVHNEKLFYQNAEVLKKIILMLQDIKLKTQKQNQFLGDLFEGFLDQGIKQSEGQFFTPMPIVKFLISSLPLQNLIAKAVEPPKVIDYACGAGHFLNEYGHQIIPIVKENLIKKYGNELAEDSEEFNAKLHDNLKTYYKAVYGIEKEYRLSKVSKVSAFMYGQNDINIIYADALVPNTQVKERSFSLLIANPPYSVKGFLETLTEEQRSNYELIEKVNSISKNDSIETFFLERAMQLLNDNGIAAIVFPSTILNKSNIYIKCREILLEKFQIIAIVNLGSGTFGKTSSTTSTLFLRRRKEIPSESEQYKNRVETWFSGDFSKDEIFEDNYFVQQYCDYNGYDYEDYKTLLNGEPNEALLKNDIFKEYNNYFDAKSTNERTTYIGLNDKAKNIQKKIRDRVKNKKAFSKQTKEEQEAEIKNEFIRFITEIEKEKLYVFILTQTNQSNVLIIKSPKGAKEIKNFLGYEWSTAKGNEGIKYLNVAKAKLVDGEAPDDDTLQQIWGLDGIQTPLFNPLNIKDENKINSLICKIFENGKVEIPDNLKDFVSQECLTNLIDFSGVTFKKDFQLQAIKKVEIKSKFPLVRLGEVFDENPKSKIKVGEAKQNENGEFPFFTSGENIYRFSDYLVDGENIFLSTGGNAVVKYYEGKAAYSTDTYVIKTKNADKIKTYYLYLLLENMIDDINLNYFKGMGLKHLQKPDFKQIRIPLPPLTIQQEIVTACQAIDNESQAAQNSIVAKRKEIEAVVNAVSGEMKKLEDCVETLGGLWTGKKPPFKTVSVIRNTNFTMSGNLNLNDVAQIEVEENSYKKRKLEKGDIIIEKSGGSETQAVGRVVYFDEDGEYAYSNFTARLRLTTDKLVPRFLHIVLNGIYQRGETFKYQAGSSGLKNLNFNEYLTLKIPVPALSVQREIVAKVTALEAEIVAAEKIVAGAAERKKKVLADRL